MPIVVNPGYVWPPETEPVVSPDGRITAIVDPAHAGVLLRADYSDVVKDTPAVPEKVLRRNLAKNPSFTDLSEQAGNGLITSTSGAIVATSTDWSDTGDTSLKITPNNENTSTAEVIVRGNSATSSDAAKTLTVSAVFHQESTQTGALWDNARRIVIRAVYGGTANSSFAVSPMADNVPGSRRLSVTFTLPSNLEYWYILLTNGSATTPAYWDSMLIEEGGRGPYFDGDTPASNDKHYRYTDDGTSEEYTPAQDMIPGQDSIVAKVRFERQDGTVVRSGSPAWAPGGYAHAYDHEATLGGGTLWRAVPILFDGTEGTPSEYVGAVIPALSDGWAWLKPVADPDKAMLLKVEPPDLSYDGRVDTTSIAGASRPAATWDVLEGFTTQLRSLVREKPVADQLMALLDEGPVLAQFPDCAGLPDFYFIRGKVDLEHVHWDGYPWRRYQWDVISIDRPDTTDSPLRIPELSYDTVERDWTTYDQLAATVTSYNKLLEP